MNSEKPLENGDEKKAKKPITRGERIRAGLFVLVFGLPVVLGVAWVIFSTPHPLTGPSTTRKNALSQQ